MPTSGYLETAFKPGQGTIPAGGVGGESRGVTFFSFSFSFFGDKKS